MRCGHLLITLDNRAYIIRHINSLPKCSQSTFDFSWLHSYAIYKPTGSKLKQSFFSFWVFIDTGSIKPTWIGLCKLFIKILAAVVFQGSDYHFLTIKRLLCSYSPLIDRYFKKVKKYSRRDNKSICVDCICVGGTRFSKLRTRSLRSQERN